MTKNKRGVLLGTIYPTGAEQYEGQEFLEEPVGEEFFGQEFLKEPVGAEQYEGENEDMGQYDVYIEPTGDVYRRGRPQLRPSGVVGQIGQEKLAAAQARAGGHLRATSTGDVVDPETFAISSISGSPGAFTLSANTPGTRTAIGTYTVPTGYRIIFDPSDVYQEVIFTPFSSVGIEDAYFIVGDMDVVLESATGGKAWRIFHSSTIYMRPASNISSVGHLRKWQSAYIAVPGDAVNFYFTAGTALSTANSVLIARVRVGRIVA